MSGIIEVRDLKKEFVSVKRGEGLRAAVKSFLRPVKEKKMALDGVTFSIPKGEICGFLGPNGAGKSTCIKIMSGIMYPTSGEVQVMGVNPWDDRKEYVHKIGVVFGQKSQLWWDLPPVDSMHLNKAIYSIPDKRFDSNLSKMVKMLGVEDVISRPTRTLSLGERMKCDFMIAMLHDPSVVFLDEPTIGLDVFAKESIREFVSNWNRKKGTTFILTTHDLDDIERLASRIVVIDKGRVIFDDQLERLRKEMGARKYVTVSCKNPIGKVNHGSKVLKKISSSEKQYLIDTAKTGIGEFIKQVSGGNHLVDLMVEEPPIEEIIKELYARGK